MNTSAQPPKIAKETLFITAWVLFGAAFAFYISRLAIRAKFTGRLWLDDWLAGVALVLLLADALLITFMANSMYDTLKLASIQVPLGPRDIFKRASMNDTISFYMKMQFAEMIVFWSCLWMVKASFLAFFHRLTNNLRKYVIAWWCIVVLCVLSYIAAMISYPISCTSFQPLDCENPRSARLSMVSLRLSTILDIVTDILIIALPMSLAVRVKLPMKTKLALCGIFALGGLIVIMAIVRIIITQNNIGKRPEVSWLNLWSAVEASTAVIVCNLAVFKFLFRGRAGEYSSGAYQNRKKYTGGSAKPLSEKMMTSQRSGTYGRNSTSYIQSPSRSYPSKRGLQTHVTAIPLTERNQNGWEHGFGEIVVTREVDQMTADDYSIYDHEDEDTSKPQSRSLSKRSPPISHTAHSTPPISHQTSFYNPGRDSSPTSFHAPVGRLERRKSDGSNELFLPPVKTGGKFHFGTPR